MRCCGFPCFDRARAVVAVFLVFYLVLGVTLVLGDDDSGRQRSLRIQRVLEKINKPGIASIQSPDGDIIDCVPIANQPAFDHPLLQGSKLQISPSNSSFLLASKSGRKIQQRWHQAGQRCPKGSIPVRRTLELDVERIAQQRENHSIDSFARKSQGPPHVDSHKSLQAAVPSSSRQHEHAIAYAEGVFYGAEAVINVWDPSVEGADEFSLSQVWILSGTFNVDLNSVEAGWQVNPALYGDRNPRFFTYWTSDSYRGTGCYNLLCEGFVQINDQVVLGGAVAPVSSLNGVQYDIRILIFKDFITGNWWLRYGDELIGYWPPQLFTHLAGFANVIEWGGEVVNTRPNNRHTATQMGSGHYPQSGYAVASYLKNLRVVDLTSLLRGPASIFTLSTKPDCYSIRSSGGTFFYGGPGLSSSCQ
ncbi:uncharacterized protein LOC9630026 [Selaginella moellendorffii]|uniref:uncharacterized protein LOC9630026 n=1 Tax=Selaginella moellendorffii TaxID=88036 RepID=UPI000D1CBF45|nr:uncharacterized protein LOC9630026 [Selaginella moellendorffii]|eukprot:XP_024536499.1 uncharacterized protein LOC9630026 [Selaginella moellendorffii]